jgi:hypothetical protein
MWWQIPSAILEMLRLRANRGTDRHGGSNRRNVLLANRLKAKMYAAKWSQSSSYVLANISCPAASYLLPIPDGKQEICKALSLWTVWKQYCISRYAAAKYFGCRKKPVSQQYWHNVLEQTLEVLTYPYSNTKFSSQANCIQKPCLWRNSNPQPSETKIIML